LSIADAIYRAVTDDTLRKDLIAKGFSRARHFSWRESVAQIHRIYFEVLDR
jgi:glycosyltransferase involved in cell wall biosynthesis